MQVEARSGVLRIHHDDGMSCRYNHYLKYLNKSLVESRPLKRRKVERTQLPENFEAAHDDIPYLDADLGIMDIDFGGDFLSSLNRQ